MKMQLGEYSSLDHSIATKYTLTEQHTIALESQTHFEPPVSNLLFFRGNILHFCEYTMMLFNKLNFITKELKSNLTKEPGNQSQESEVNMSRARPQQGEGGNCRALRPRRQAPSAPGA